MPRMSTTQKLAISAPAVGLYVYDTDVNSYSFYNGSQWVTLGAGFDSDWTIDGINMYSGVTGNVGIGTMFPDRKLHVMSSNSGWGMARFQNENPGQNEVSIAFLEGSDVAGTDIWVMGVGSWGHPGDLVIGRGSEKLTLDYDGNLGIGTSDPYYKLDVAGPINVNKDISSGMALYVNGSPAIEYFDNTFYWGGTKTNYFHHNIGIGTGDPTTYLHISKPGVALRGQLCITDDTGDDSFITFYEGETFKSYVGTIDGVAQWGSFDGSEMIIGAYGGGNVGVGADLLDESKASLFTNSKDGSKTKAITHKLTVGNTADDNVLRLVGPDIYGHGARLNFGDGDYVYIEEDQDDYLRVYSSYGTNFLGGGDVSLVYGGHLVVGDVAATNIGIDDNEIMARNAGGSSELNLNREGGNIIMNELDGNVGIGTYPSAKLHVNGTARCSILQITGGADIAEPFDIIESENVQPGMVMVIDQNNPGKLKISNKEYDRRVAGIISGAGEINPGMIMGQDNSIADGDHPIALSGRVYCLAETSNGSISPGDLITTSDTPGYAMKVTDYTKAHGAIIGKAMTSLKSGDGLILVLVALQ